MPHLRPLILALLAGASLLPAQTSAPARGRALFLEHGCVHCHAEKAPGALTGQSLAGPDLRKAGERLDPAWLDAWLRDPQAVHADARMPRLFADSEQGRAEAADVAAWLASLGGPFKRVDHDRGETDSGRRLFIVRGCVACHREDDTDDGRHLLRDLAAKTDLKHLTRTIQKPLDLHPRGAMPDLALSEADARKIARYLLREDAAPLPEAPAGDAKRGAALARARGCAACHTLPAAGAQERAPAELARISGRSDGCLAEAPADGLPRFALTADERGALAAFLENPLRPETPPDQLHRRLTQLRCTACHERDGQGGMAAPVRDIFYATTQADALDLMQPPDLTDLHARLDPRWVERVLRDRARARPYMKIRMPHYAPELTDGLSELLAGEMPDTSRMNSTLEEIEVGRKLVGSSGFGCVICHDFGGEAATGSRAPDLALVHARLREPYLERWITDPSAVRPGTRMPTYFRNGKSALSSVMDGDAKAQVRAIMAYLAQGDRMEPPSRPGPVRDTVLGAEQAPLVWRTILPGLTPRGMGIHFPRSLAVAVDLKTPRIGYVWQGGFLDMRRKWTGRGDGPADLVGAKLVDGAPGPMFWQIGGARVARFAGHRLEETAVALDFALGDEVVTITLDAVRCDAAHGLRVRVDWRGSNVLGVLLGEAHESLQQRSARGRSLVRLATARDACFVASDTLAPADPVRLTLAGGSRGEAILWFPTSLSDEALKQCLEWRQ